MALVQRPFGELGVAATRGTTSGMPRTRVLREPADLFVEELGHFAVVARWCTAGRPCDHQHNLSNDAAHAPDFQRLALVEEHEGAGIVKIISEIER